MLETESGRGRERVCGLPADYFSQGSSNTEKDGGI
jgi:hypothetical protein